MITIYNGQCPDCGAPLTYFENKGYNATWSCRNEKCRFIKFYDHIKNIETDSKDNICLNIEIPENLYHLIKETTIQSNFAGQFKEQNCIISILQKHFDENGPGKIKR